MKQLSIHSNLGDTLSAIKFNFNCLDVHTCNFQEQTIGWQSDLVNWGNIFTEVRDISSNWKSMSTHTHNASTFWDFSYEFLIYPTPFIQGQNMQPIILNWLNVNFPAYLYQQKKVFIVQYVVWSKNPALHRPSSKSVSQFGVISETNNVFIENTNWYTFIQKENSWHFLQGELLNDCSYLKEVCECWGGFYIPTNPVPCFPQSTFYELVSQGSVVTLNASNVKIFQLDFDFSAINSTLSFENWTNTFYGLVTNPIYKSLSSTSLVKYSHLPTQNPDVDNINDVWLKYLNKNKKPSHFNQDVNEDFVKSLRYEYVWDATEESFTLNIRPLSCNGSWELSSTDTHFFRFDTNELISYLRYTDNLDIFNIDFNLNIDTSWYRWVTTNVYDISSNPYWHIGVDFDQCPVLPLTSLDALSALFGLEISNISPDPLTAWELSYNVLGSNLSAFFGTTNDWFGLIDEISISAVS